MNKDSLTCQLIQKAGRFAAVALDQRADMMAIGRFGFRTGRDMDKFEGIPYKEDAAGMPYPTATACAHYSCKVEQTVDLGTHLLFVGLAGNPHRGRAPHLQLLPQRHQGPHPQGRALLPGQKVKSKGEGPRESGALFAAFINLPRPA